MFKYAAIFLATSVLLTYFFRPLLPSFLRFITGVFGYTRLQKFPRHTKKNTNRYITNSQ